MKRPVAGEWIQLPQLRFGGGGLSELKRLAREVEPIGLLAQVLQEKSPLHGDRCGWTAFMRFGHCGRSPR
ncbi:hypothetical protein SUDANB57_06509 (plasmid) [Streptomyces sp. enrichment culture]